MTPTLLLLSAAQYQHAPAQYQGDTDVVNTHQNDIVEAPHNKPDSAPADTPSGPPPGIDLSVTMRPPHH